MRQCTRAADIVRQWRAADIKAAAQRLDLPTHAVQTEHASLDTGSASDQLAALLRPYQADQKQVIDSSLELGYAVGLAILLPRDLCCRHSPALLPLFSPPVLC